MISDGELEPGRYRITMDDGITIDRELTGVSRLAAGDILTAQPDDITAAETAHEYQIPVGRVSMITTRDGEVWLLPTNRLSDAERAIEAEIVTMAFDYLDRAPFRSPDLFIYSDDEIAAMATVLRLDRGETPAEGAESPDSGSEEDAEGSTPPAAETDADSPKDGAPAEAQESSPEPSSASLVDPLASLPNQPDSPVLAESLPPAGSPDAPSDRATAAETLVVTPHEPVAVNVEDEP